METFGLIRWNDLWYFGGMICGRIDNRRNKS